MAGGRRTIRVFVGSPGDVEAEREVVPNVLDELNDVKAHALGYHLEAVGWEDTRPGLGRPQERINEALDNAHVAVMVLWKRWGSATGEYSSGFLEEFERCRETETPVLLYFKDIEPEEFEDPGPQLRRVEAFRTKIQEENAALFRRFDDVETYADMLKRDLADWLDDYDHGVVPEDMLVRPGAWLRSLSRDEERSRELVEHLLTEPPARARFSELLAEEGAHRSRAGFIERAGRLYQAALELWPSPLALQGYQHHLISIGRMDEAQEIADRLEEVAQETGNKRAEVFALEGKGRIEEVGGNLEQAEELFRKSAKIGRTNDLSEPVASAEMHIGVIYRTRGNLDEARTHLEEAIGIARAMEDFETLCSAQNHLAAALISSGEYQEAADVSHAGMELAEEHGLTREVSIAGMHLAILCRHQERFEEAASWIKESLSIAREQGDEDVELQLTANLANLMGLRGDVDEAESLMEDALKMAESGRNVEALAMASFNLGSLLSSTGREEQGRRHLRKAAGLFGSLGNDRNRDKAINMIAEIDEG